jgi:hypothetical protein
MKIDKHSRKIKITVCCCEIVLKTLIKEAFIFTFRRLVMKDILKKRVLITSIAFEVAVLDESKPKLIHVELVV